MIGVGFLPFATGILEGKGNPGAVGAKKPRWESAAGFRDGARKRGRRGLAVSGKRE
jgi:hypothetical protein